jgi:hypothetical protein
MTKIILLTPTQRTAIDRAANSLLPPQREAFYDNVARRLGNEPGDAAVQIAIDNELALNRLPNFIK